MRKSELIVKMTAKQKHLSLEDITLSVDHLLTYLGEALGEKGRLEIRGFGNLTVHHQDAREARNPKTGEMVQVPAKNKVRFKMGKDLMEKLN